MKIAILGTRGVPNNYGGFEQFAEYLSEGLVRRGHIVSVYNPHSHPYQKKQWKGVHIIHKFDPEIKLGTAGQFIYDFNCILDCRKRNFDIILQLGYTSSSVWGWLLPRKPVIITNMDGLEWKRSKYSRKVQQFIKFAEKLAVQTSDFLIADSLGIQKYLFDEYNTDSHYIPYGAIAFEEPNIRVLDLFKVPAYAYNMLVARLEPENNIEVILEGVANASAALPMLVIGNHKSAYGKFLVDKFKPFTHIQFIGTIYDINILNNLRYYSNIYFHGHTVGGTNPSLLEAMASQSLICAHNNEFNQAILGNDALYFETSAEITSIIDKISRRDGYIISFISNNLAKIKAIYSWDKIVCNYEEYLLEKSTLIIRPSHLNVTALTNAQKIQ